MSLDVANVIDAAGLDISTNSVVLSIIDGWNWEDEAHHLLSLQSKINSYLEFIETGQIFQSYPHAKDRQVRIDIISKYSFPRIASEFIERANSVSKQLNVTIRQRLG